MKKVLMVTLAIEVDELPEQVRGEMLSAFGMEENELPGVTDIEPNELAEEIVYAIDDKDRQAELVWAGSEMYARFGKIEITEAKWKA